MMERSPFFPELGQIGRRPLAAAHVRGSKQYSAVDGWVYFYPMPRGVLVVARMTGLPEPTQTYPTGIFGFHIHSGSRCSGTLADPFADTMGHYHPTQTPHPRHAGDLPPLFGNHDYAFQAFVTDRFTARQLQAPRVRSA